MKRSRKTVGINSRFSYYFCLMIEGSRSAFVPRTVLIYGSRRPKNLNTDCEGRCYSARPYSGEMSGSEGSGGGANSYAREKAWSFKDHLIILDPVYCTKKFGRIFWNIFGKQRRLTKWCFYLGPALVMDADILFPRQRALLSGRSPAHHFFQFISYSSYISCAMVYDESIID